MSSTTTSDPGYVSFVAAPTAAGRPDVVVAAANDGMVHVSTPTTATRSSRTSRARCCARPVAGLAVDGGQADGHPGADVPGRRRADLQAPFLRRLVAARGGRRLQQRGREGRRRDWHTIVVGGLGKGGNSYYALDLTDAERRDEAAGGGQGPVGIHRRRIGSYTYGRPVIVKTYAYGWVVIVTVGLQQRDRRRARSTSSTRRPARRCAQPIDEPAGLPGRRQPERASRRSTASSRTSTTRSSSRSTAATSAATCGASTSPTPNRANWTVDKLFAMLTDPSGHGAAGHHRAADRDRLQQRRRPLRVHRHRPPARRDDLTDADAGAAADDVRDPRRHADDADRRPRACRSTPRATLAAIAGGRQRRSPAARRTAGTTTCRPAATAERIVVDVEADVNIVTYIGTQVQNDPCIIALPAYIYARDYTTRQVADRRSAANRSVRLSIRRAASACRSSACMDPVTGAISLGGLAVARDSGHEAGRRQEPVFGGRNRFSWRLLRESDADDVSRAALRGAPSGKSKRLAARGRRCPRPRRVDIAVWHARIRAPASCAAVGTRSPARRIAVEAATTPWCTPPRRDLARRPRGVDRRSRVGAGRRSAASTARPQAAHGSPRLSRRVLVRSALDAADRTPSPSTAATGAVEPPAAAARRCRRRDAPANIARDVSGRRRESPQATHAASASTSRTSTLPTRCRARDSAMRSIGDALADFPVGSRRARSACPTRSTSPIRRRRWPRGRRARVLAWVDRRRRGRRRGNAHRRGRPDEFARGGRSRRSPRRSFMPGARQAASRSASTSRSSSSSGSMPTGRRRRPRRA